MPDRGNILLVANWESGVGYAWWLMENFWVTIADNFKYNKTESYLIYPKITHIPKSIKESNIEIFECDFHDHSFPNLIRLRRIIKQCRITFVYLSDSPSYSFFYLVLRTWGVRVIVVHDHTPGDRSPARSWKRLIKTIIQNTPLITADHFIAVTEFVYQRLLNVACIPAQKCSIAPNGIIPIEQNNPDIGYTQKTFGIPDDRIIIITTGRASLYKGIDFFIECANELINIKKLDQLHFLYCGDGPDIESFRFLVDQFKLHDHFTFAGNRTDIRKILPSCHIGFHAAAGEVGYSLSILEYMSAGLITIVPDLPSVSLAIKHMQNGILYKPRDVTDATHAIVYAVENAENNKIQENAKRLIREELNLDNTNQKLISILQSVFT